MQNGAQTCVDRTLQAGGQSANVLGKEIAVEGEDLGDIDNRVARKPRRASRQKDVAWIGRLLPPMS